MSKKLFLQHTGTPQKFDFDPNGSGRYRQGSGENPHQHGFDFLYEIQKLKESGDFKDETEIARYLGYSTTEYRAKKSILRAEKEREDAGKIKHMYYDRHQSKSAIARELGISDKKVDNILKDCESVKNAKLRSTEEVLLKSVKEKEWIDVSEGVEKDLGISKPMLKAALQKIEEDGEYEVKKIQVAQINSGTGQKTTTLVLCPKGTTTREIYLDLNKIKLINEYYSEDLGLTYGNMERPAPVSSDRISFTYADKDGYQPKDGIIELRPGVEDLSLGDAKYAQVRINVDDKYYLKGMAYYNPDLPKGTDIRFNSSKQEGTPIEKVLKPMQTVNGEPDGPIDWDNPFGANLKANGRGQSYYIGKDGKKHLSAINKLSEEGDWGEWSKTLAAQFLSKQPLELARKQLNITYLDKISEFEEIKSIPNTTVRKFLLESFADDCDASAEDLKATSMPRQATQVLLALESIKKDEVYAPNFHEGEHVALIRYPHNGPCEILNLKVNNKNQEAIKLFSKTPKDCVVINPKNLQKLSGADQDGDNVVVIPNKKIGKGFAIKSDPILKDLENFDPHIQYAASPGCALIKTDAQKGIEMGKITNLIADMQIQGADSREVARAIKHSMVIIDAKKHKLDYKASERDNDIKSLRIKYQGNAQGGSSTLITRAKSPVEIPKRSMYFKVDPETGEKIYTEPKIKTRKVWYKGENGEWSSEDKPLTETISKMANTKNAFDLLSDPKKPYEIEVIYGTYANAMKKMANDARKEAYWTKSEPVSKKAQEAYAKEIESLVLKNNMASRNAPYERKAQRVATVIMKEKKEANPNMSKKEIRKKAQQALNAARARYIPGGKKERVIITEKEMEAINNNAINSTLVKSILKNTKTENIMEMALPRKQRGLSISKITAAKAMLNSGLYTQAEVAKKFGISATTLMKYVNGK